MKSIRYLPLLFISTYAAAAQTSTFSLSIDNDGVFGVDQNYTNGLFLSYTSGAITPYWLAKPLSLSIWGAPSLDKWEFTLGHKMWTPSDIELTKPQPNERPYAGYLHTEFNYLSLHPQQAQRFNLTLGMTGESALSEEAQKLVHSITKSDEPNGWAYQVEDQLVGSLGYRSHFNWGRYHALAGTELELANISEVNIGNFRSDLSSGLMLRWGTDLETTLAQPKFGENRLPRHDWASNQGWFVFTGIEGRYRFNDVTIEGDRPLNGLDQPAEYYQVHIEPWQATAVVGFAMYARSFGASLTFTANTPEFKEDKESISGTGNVALYAFF
ncbi:exonuclease [Vibrio cholerae]|nr:exonuclease [Vibrio cholerae]